MERRAIGIRYLSFIAGLVLLASSGSDTSSAQPAPERGRVRPADFFLEDPKPGERDHRQDTPGWPIIGIAGALLALGLGGACAARGVFRGRSPLTGAAAGESRRFRLEVESRGGGKQALEARVEAMCPAREGVEIQSLPPEQHRTSAGEDSFVFRPDVSLLFTIDLAREPERAKSEMLRTVVEILESTPGRGLFLEDGGKRLLHRDLQGRYELDRDPFWRPEHLALLPTEPLWRDPSRTA